MAYVYAWLEFSYKPQKSTLDSMRMYTFVIHILSMLLASVSIFSVCCYFVFFSVEDHYTASCCFQIQDCIAVQYRGYMVTNRIIFEFRNREAYWTFLTVKIWIQFCDNLLQKDKSELNLFLAEKY